MRGVSILIGLDGLLFFSTYYSILLFLKVLPIILFILPIILFIVPIILIKLTYYSFGAKMTTYYSRIILNSFC